MMRRSEAIACLGMLGCLGWVISLAYGDSQELYLRLNHDRLFSELGITAQTAEVTSSFRNRVVGVTFRAEYPNALNVYSVSCGVYTSIERAKQDCRLRCAVRQTPPTAYEPSEGAIGDEVYCWASGPGSESPHASVVFRRGNVVFDIQNKGNPEEALAVARGVDNLVSQNREIAPRGVFDPTPDITHVGIPGRLMVRPMRERVPRSDADVAAGRPEWRSPGGTPFPLAYVVIHPEFQGLGDISKVRIRLIRRDGFGDSVLLDDRSPLGREFGDRVEPYYVPVGPEEVRPVPRSQAAAEGVDGRFIMRVGVPDESKVVKFLMIAATEDNVIVTKEISVRIEKAK